MNFSADEKSAVALQLGACLAVQRTYGKQAGDLTAVARIFLNDLHGFTGDQIAGALSAWRKKSPEFPTPADIHKILNPELPLDRDVYRSLVAKRNRGELSEFSKGAEYIKLYEQEILKHIN